jgi:Ca2+-binding RTX toxin-like protein
MVELRTILSLRSSGFEGGLAIYPARPHIAGFSGGTGDFKPAVWLHTGPSTASDPVAGGHGRQVCGMRALSSKGVLGCLAGTAAFCALALTLLPATAFASTAYIRIERVFYTAAPSELNDLDISATSTNFVLVDSGAQITPGPGCTAAGNSAACPIDRINGLTVSLGDGADRVDNMTSAPSTLSGGDGNDSLNGGSGNDILRGNKGVDTQSGGAGDDLIDSRGDKGDIITCGPGNDTVRADSADSIASDCEIIDRAPPPPPPPTPGSGPSPAATGLLGPGESRKLRAGACATDMLGTPADDLLSGTSLGETLFGLQGNDILRGLPGDDCLFGGLGSDRLSGSDGDDRLLGDDAARGPRGNDSLSGNAGDDLLVGGPGRDRLYGGAGGDRIRGGRGSDRLRSGPGSNRLSGGPGSDRLHSANRRRDRVNCGRGRRDRARVDRIDRVRACERVTRR